MDGPPQQGACQPINGLTRKLMCNSTWSFQPPLPASIFTLILWLICSTLKNIAASKKKQEGSVHNMIKTNKRTIYCAERPINMFRKKQGEKKEKGISKFTVYIWRVKLKHTVRPKFGQSFSPALIINEKNPKLLISDGCGSKQWTFCTKKQTLFNLGAIYYTIT